MTIAVGVKEGDAVMQKIVRIGGDTREKRMEIFPSPSKAKQNAGWHMMLKYAHGADNNRTVLWMQFLDLDSMEEFGQTLVDYARKNR